MNARDSIFVFEDKILTIEAEEAVKEINFAVDHVEIARSLPYSRDLVYLNLTTKENKNYCIELSEAGFRIVGPAYNTIDKSREDSTFQYFETIYSLLDHVSPEYRMSFGDALMMKLSQLKEKEDDDDDDAVVEEEAT